jgi:hypothetical protein
MSSSHVYLLHVANWPRGYSNDYCSHVANYMFFCSVVSLRYLVSLLVDRIYIKVL